MTNQHVGAWVKARRATLKLGVKRAADLAGISRTAWYDLEHDRHPPGTDTQAGVAHALAVGRDWYDRLQAGDQPEPLEPADAAVRLAELERLLGIVFDRLDVLTNNQEELFEKSHRHEERRHGDAEPAAL